MQCLRSLVEAAGLESKTIASTTNTSPSTVSLNLSGGRLPQRSTVEAIIHLCQVTDEVR
ncbi:helix-turn-helix domain-containing protein, partial [Streptomyces sp. SID7760]|nr:helix-turn-helix domain-containing protein [Streptomyces sp. SID7760]